MAKTPNPKLPHPPVQPDGTEASAASTGADVAGHPPARTSILESVRRNRMGVLTAALVVSLVLALLLSMLVPTTPGAFVMILLGTIMAFAVGFTVRYLSTGRGLLTQLVAFVATILGVHVMAVTGVASGSIPALESLGAAAPSFNEALLVALAVPALSAGGVVAGLVAAIIAGWGPKPVDRIDLD